MAKRVPAGNSVTNGESDFESRGFIDGYAAGYISVQCLRLPEIAIFTDTSAAPNPLYLTRNSKRLLGGRYRERKIIPVSIHWESQAS